jgi:hypothetical protein
MKTLVLRAALAFLCLGCAQGTLRIDGTATWSITKPDCTLEVVGAIQNYAPVNTSSGTLKLALWVTASPFPSQGIIVAETILQPLRGGAQLTDIHRKVPVDLSGLTGDYHFTLVLMEYTLSGWFNRIAIPSSPRTLDNGDFLDDATWRAKGNTFLPPPAALAVGQRLRLQTKANSTFTRITAGTEADLFITVEEEDEATLRRGSTSGTADISYKRGRDSLRGKRHRTGRVSIYSNGVREAEVSLFFSTSTKGIYRMVGGGRVTWGDFLLR